MIGFDLLGAAPADLQSQRGDRIYYASASLGAVAAAIALALVWRTHRVLGGLLGFFVLGPLVGASVGLLLSRGDIQKLKKASRNWVPQVGDKVRGSDIMGRVQAGVIDQINYGASTQVHVRWADGNGSIAHVSKLVRI